MTCNCGICQHNSLPLLQRLKSHTGTAHRNESEAAAEIERLREALQYYADDDAYHDRGMGIGVDADVAKQALAAQAAERGEG